MWWGILRRGIQTGSKVQKIIPSSPLELIRPGVKGGVPIDTASGSFAVTRAANRATKAVLESPLAGTFSPLNWALRLAKYNSRLVSAQHLLYFKPAEEIKAAVIARRLAQEQGALSAAEAVLSP